MSLVVELPSSFVATLIFVFVILGVLMMTLHVPVAKPAIEIMYQGATH